VTRERIRNWLAVFGTIAIFLAIMPVFEYRGGGNFDRATSEHVLANPGDMPFTED
jgi:hypothetical protein